MVASSFTNMFVDQGSGMPHVNRDLAKFRDRERSLVHGRGRGGHNLHSIDIVISIDLGESLGAVGNEIPEFP